MIIDKFQIIKKTKKVENFQKKLNNLYINQEKTLKQIDKDIDNAKNALWFLGLYDEKKADYALMGDSVGIVKTEIKKIPLHIEFFANDTKYYLDLFKAKINEKKIIRLEKMLKNLEHDKE